MHLQARGFFQRIMTLHSQWLVVRVKTMHSDLAVALDGIEPAPRKAIAIYLALL